MNSEATFKFFNVRTNEFVTVKQEDIGKFIYRRFGAVRYGLRGVITDGQSAVKFVDKEIWDSIDAPVTDDGRRERE